MEEFNHELLAHWERNGLVATEIAATNPFGVTWKWTEKAKVEVPLELIRDELISVLHGVPCPLYLRTWLTQYGFDPRTGRLDPKAWGSEFRP